MLIVSVVSDFMYGERLTRYQWAAVVMVLVGLIVIWAANKRFEISKIKSKINSNSRELELTNLLGLVLGCIEAKFAFWQICAMPVDMGVPACSLRDNTAAGFYG